MSSGGRYGDWNPTNVPSLTARAERLVDVAVRSTPDEFQRALAVEVRNIQRDDDIARLERQRRATRLRSWVDGEGMWCLTGRFDPETGLALHGRLDATIATLFTDSVPDGCPDDPLERHGYLRAHALVALTHGRGGAWGRPEVIVVVDTTTPDPTGPPPSTGDSPSNSPPRSSTASSLWPTSTPSSCTEASSSTPPDNSTWDAPPASPTGPNAAPSGPCTPPAPSPAAPPATTYANSTTSTGGNTAGQPTSTTCCEHPPLGRTGWVR